MDIPILAEPIQLTDEPLTGTELSLLAGYGWKGVCYQVQNGANRNDFDMGVVTSAGMVPLVWGVIYPQVDSGNNPRGLSPYAQGLLLGQQAQKHPVQEVIVDAEYVAINTRGTDVMRAVVRGIREGLFRGRISLCPLGAPSNPKQPGKEGNDYAVDLEPFLSSGGFVFPQAYANAYDEYDPLLCYNYWQAVGVPAGRINIMFSMRSAESNSQYPNRRLSGTEWVMLLERLPLLGRRISCFMAKSAEEPDLIALQAITRRPGFATQTFTDPLVLRDQAKDKLSEAVSIWKKQGKTREVIMNTKVYRALVVLNPEFKL